MSFHEFTKYDRFRHVADAAGEKWTITIERGNAFQGWRWFNGLDETMGVEGGPITLVLAAVVDWPFRLAKVIAFRLRMRRDWRVTVRRGVHSDRGPRRDAVVDELVASKVAAAKRANNLVREIESGAFSERVGSADQTSPD